jgi:hypothetical protein
MDVIVGGVMLGIGVAAIMSISARALSSQTDGEKRMVAAWLADEMLNMVLIEGPVDYPRQNDTFGVFDAPFGDFEYDVEIKDLGRGVPFEVTVSIAWPAGDPDTGVQVQTRIAQRPPIDPALELRGLEEPLDRDSRYFDEEGAR